MIVWGLHPFQEAEKGELRCLLLVDRIVFPADTVFKACFQDLPVAGPKKHMKKQDIRKAQYSIFPTASWKDVHIPDTGRCQNSTQLLTALPWSSPDNAA